MCPNPEAKPGGKPRCPTLSSRCMQNFKDSVFMFFPQREKLKDSAFFPGPENYKSVQTLKLKRFHFFSKKFSPFFLV